MFYSLNYVLYDIFGLAGVILRTDIKEPLIIKNCALEL